MPKEKKKGFLANWSGRRNRKMKKEASSSSSSSLLPKPFQTRWASNPPSFHLCKFERQPRWLLLIKLHGCTILLELWKKPLLPPLPPPLPLPLPLPPPLQWGSLPLVVVPKGYLSLSPSLSLCLSPLSPSFSIMGREEEKVSVDKFL